MTNLEKLLNGIEVEWKPLGEVCEFLNGYAFKSNLFHDTGLPIVRITNIDGKKINLKDVKFFDPADYNNGNPLNYAIVKGDILIAMSGATTGKIGYYNIEETAYLNQRVGKFIPNKTVLNSRYLYHFLLTKSDFLYILAGGGAQPNLSSNSIKEKLFIPIPPIAIQNKIADILDKFATLEAELEAELDCRKRQYDYYRNKLLNSEPSNNVSLIPLGNIAKNLDSMRKPITSGQREKGIIPYYGASGIVDYVKDYIYDGDFLLISEDGANLIARNTPIAFSINGKSWVNNHAHVLEFETYEERKFVEYYLNNIDLTPYISGAAQPKLNQKNLNSILIPQPYISEQQRIVSILDKFDKLTTSISEGLPAEIELRRKQYEYYRNKLLSFPNAKITQ